MPNPGPQPCSCAGTVTAAHGAGRRHAGSEVRSSRLPLAKPSRVQGLHSLQMGCQLRPPPVSPHCGAQPLLLSSLCVSTRLAFSPEPGGGGGVVVRVLSSLLHRGCWTWSHPWVFSSWAHSCATWTSLHTQQELSVHMLHWWILQGSEGCLRDMGTGPCFQGRREERLGQGTPQLPPAAHT